MRGSGVQGFWGLGFRVFGFLGLRCIRFQPDKGLGEQGLTKVRV